MNGKRTLSILLALLLAMSAALPLHALAEDADDEEFYIPTDTEIALEGRPAKDEILHVTVGNPNKVKGNFFTRLLGNNTSDIDVRSMIHGYDLIVWDIQPEFITDPQVVKDLKKTAAGDNTLYTVTIADDLVYNDGETQITAADYVFSLLLFSSKEMAQLGGDISVYNHIVGWDEYSTGKAKTLSGVRLISPTEFSVEIKAECLPYFYELSYLSVEPFPISVIAPGCKVADDGKGAYITNEKKGKNIFTAELLEKTVMDPETGYMSSPALSCGPYKFLSWDSDAGTVEFEINHFYKGNYEGVKPYIDEITLVYAPTATMVDRLASGEVNLLNKCVDGTVILDAIGRQMDDVKNYNYARLGYGYLAVSCEKGPQQFPAVRQAIACSFDTDRFVDEYLMGFGMPVYGYYGLGQWMTMAVSGTLRPEGISEAEEAKWDELTLDNLDTYDYDLERAVQLLEDDGWVLNAQGKAYKNGIRYKQLEDGTLMPLSFVYALTDDSRASLMVRDMLQESFAVIGAELVVYPMSFAQQLNSYYRSEGVREYDLAFMGTNFVSTFDPYMTFSETADANSAMNTSGLYDEQLVQSAYAMHSTQPLDLLGFVTNWVSFQERYNQILPTIPLYSNVYFDFSSDWLQNYSIASRTNWPDAILYAFWAEPKAEEEPDGEDDMMDDENTMDLSGDDIIIE
ncbi:MAG: ABC transporter substrate-binding protein [Clostridia bacterium]|nr:ABC transporter substrate-binding protein [Clostridia bacterium]